MITKLAREFKDHAMSGWASSFRLSPLWELHPDAHHPTSFHGKMGRPDHLFGKAHSYCRCSTVAVDHRSKPLRMRPRKAVSSWIPTSVSMRFPVPSKNTKVVFPTP
jgi:hypothetical protein